MKVLKFWGPIVATVIIVIVLVIAIATSGAGKSQDSSVEDSQVQLNFTDEDGNVYELTDVTEVEE